MNALISGKDGGAKKGFSPTERELLPELYKSMRVEVQRDRMPALTHETGLLSSRGTTKWGSSSTTPCSSLAKELKSLRDRFRAQASGDRTSAKATNRNLATPGC